MEKIGKFVESLIESITVVVLAFMVVLVFVNACMRYFLHTNILVNEELARFSFIWMCQLGCIVAYKRKAHICITVVVDSLPAKTKRAAYILSRIVTAAALIFLTYGTWLFVKNSSEYINAGIPLNYGIMTCVALIMSVGMVLVDAVDLWRFIFRRNAPKVVQTEYAGGTIE